MKTYIVTATITVRADDETEAIQKVEGCMVWTGVEGSVEASADTCDEQQDNDWED